MSWSPTKRDRVDLEQHVRQGERGDTQHRLGGRPVAPDPVQHAADDVQALLGVIDDVRAETNDVAVPEPGDIEGAAQLAKARSTCSAKSFDGTWPSSSEAYWPATTTSWPSKPSATWL